MLTEYELQNPQADRVLLKCALCLLILALLALSGAKSDLQSDVSLNAHAASAQDEESGAKIEPQQSFDEMTEAVLDIVGHGSYFLRSDE